MAPRRPTGWASVLRYGYAPFMYLGINGLAIWLAEASAAAAMALGLIVGAVGVSFAAERVLPYEIDWNRSHGDAGRDACHAVVNEAANLASVGLLPLLARLGGGVAPWPSDWPFWLQVVAAILVLDCGVTLAHWASHRLEILWRIHAVHHSVKRLYGLNGLMKHPLHQTVEMIAGTTPLVVLGMPVAVAGALTVCTAVQLLMQHSNVDYRLGPLTTWIAGNAVHRFHHRASAVDGDVNFGLFTTLWDRLLGTAIFDPVCQVRGANLGIAGRADYPVRYFAQLVEPFRRAPRAVTTVA